MPGDDEATPGPPSTRAVLASSPPLAAGRGLGKFEILGVLGEGGTGVVYDARVFPAGSPVALKVIHHHLLTDTQIRGRFTREAAILRRLEGPHLSNILDFGELPDPRHPGVGLLYIAMPKIDGLALDVLLKRDGPLSIPRALDVMLEVLLGLKAAHAQGVIHRDLKPANVILRGGTHAIVVDFGMAKIVTGGGTGTTALTSHNMVFGTPEYMSPEQARGDELDARCDVYAAGIILYELLTGSVPFSGATPLSVLTAHLTSPPTAPRALAPARGITPALEAVILHAIAKDPAARYAGAGALAAALALARAAPDDVDAVRPAAFAPHGDDDDAHSATIPAPIPTPPPAPPRDPLPPRGPLATPGPAGLGRRAWVVLALVALVCVGLGVLLSLVFS